MITHSLVGTTSCIQTFLSVAILELARMEERTYDQIEDNVHLQWVSYLEQSDCEKLLFSFLLDFSFSNRSGYSIEELSNGLLLHQIIQIL